MNEKPILFSGPMVRALVLLLAELARRHHHYCEDSWYSCPKHPDGCANDGVGPDCNCGADKTNAEVDAILAELTQNAKVRVSE